MIFRQSHCVAKLSFRISPRWPPPKYQIFVGSMRDAWGKPVACGKPMLWEKLLRDVCEKPAGGLWEACWKAVGSRRSGNQHAADRPPPRLMRLRFQISVLPVGVHSAVFENYAGIAPANGKGG